MGNYYSGNTNSEYTNWTGTTLKLYNLSSTHFPTAGGVLPTTLATGLSYCYDSGYRIGNDVVYMLNWYAYQPTITNNNDSNYDIHVDSDAELDVYCKVNSSLQTILTSAGYNYIYLYFAQGSLTNCGVNSAQGFTQCTDGGVADPRGRVDGHWFDLESNGASATSYYGFKYYIQGLGYSKATSGTITLCSTSTGGGRSCCSSSQRACSCTNASAAICSSSSQRNCGCSSTSATACVDALTKILLPDGKTKFAKDVHIDDIVMSYTADGLVPTRIQNKYLGISAASIYKLILENGTYLFITDKHPIATANGYKTISYLDGYATLNMGDVILTITGEQKLIEIIRYDNHSMVYNFLTTTDNFIANGIVVACEDPSVTGQYIQMGQDLAIVKMCGAVCSVDAAADW